MEFLKTIGAKIASGIVGLAVVAGAISWWQMDAATQGALLTNTGRILSWIGVVLVTPWATFLLIGRIARLESNAAGGALVFAYTAAEATLLAWLFDWSISGPMHWTFYAAAVLLAGAYNLLACDWLAERVT